MPSPEEKLVLAFQRQWDIHTAADYFEIPQHEIRELADLDESVFVVDRFQLEKRLSRDKLVGLGWLAREQGVPEVALLEAMQNPPKGSRRTPAFPLPPCDEAGRYLLQREVAEAWLKTLLPSGSAWSSLGERAKALADALGCATRPCAVSERFTDTPPAVATCRCVATWDDVSRTHQEYLENGKNASLEPDHVGWHAIFDRKVRPDQLWRNDLANLENYLREHGKSLAA